MKCTKCENVVPTGELRCSSCGSAVSMLTPGELAPRLQQVRVLELVSNAPPALLWIAEKVAGHERVLIAEYEPKGGGKGVLREFNLWFQRLKTLPIDILPNAETRYAHEERLFLVFGLPAGQPVAKVVEAGLIPVGASELLRRLLNLVGRFSEAVPGCNHGWIRADTVTIQSDGKVLLGPPAFSPGELSNTQTDLRNCAAVAAQWARVTVRELDADTEQRQQLHKLEDWALAATLEWILLCKDRSPQSAGAATSFLTEASAARAAVERGEMAGALASLKTLYQGSGSTVIKREIQRAEERIAASPAVERYPEAPAENATAPRSEAASAAAATATEVKPSTVAPPPPLPQRQPSAAEPQPPAP